MLQESDEIRRQLRTLLSRQLEPAEWKTVNESLESIAGALDVGDKQTVDRERARIREIARRFSRGADSRLGKADPRPASETTKALINKVLDRLVPGKAARD